MNRRRSPNFAFLLIIFVRKTFFSGNSLIINRPFILCSCLAKKNPEAVLEMKRGGRKQKTGRNQLGLVSA
ncbi:hypothetical protein L596_006911 [Steinernema carpocapsae]|uniref:Secreted protein n=1 Tax=Steinernema carpocapsae TaxID=34508 RepID=A0A4U5P7J3_STECR|nr:hypothetical protein L596_006911 [Steinernema carpocapsae]